MRELGSVRDQVDLHDSAAFDGAADHRDRFVAAAVLFTTGMYGMAEILASRVPRQEEYIARVPAIAILPWFLAGALFPDHGSAELSDMACEVPSAHARARADALRLCFRTARVCTRSGVSPTRG